MNFARFGKGLKELLKKDPVFTVAGILAAASCFIVKPSAEYAEYIDIRTIVLLFSLMAVVAGMRRKGFFDGIAPFFAKRAGSIRNMGFSLVLISFFLSMLVTNDVALITLVPLTVIIMHGISLKYMEYVIILQTVAANLGSMMTPFGNPQNLYLYSFYRMSPAEFAGTVLMPAVMGFAAVTVLTAFLPGKGYISKESIYEHAGEKDFSQRRAYETRFAKGRFNDKMDVLIYVFLFVLCILTVFRIVPFGCSGAAVAATLFFMDRDALKEVDYGLLVTFVFFFIFVGNTGRIDAVSSILTDVLSGREVIVSALASQVISNVPAAVLLSGFTENGAKLMLGTDIGGLGTLAASMASLISLRIYMNVKGADVRRFILRFSIINFALLAAMLAVFATGEII